MSEADDDNFDPQFNGILHLEDQDFTSDGKLNLQGELSGKPVIVMVFATWCGPCRSTKPHYAELFKELNGKDVIIACINGSGETTLDSEQKLMKRIKNIIPDFRGFPHIAIFDDEGEYVDSHNGPRTTQALKGTIESYQSKSKMHKKNPSVRRQDRKRL
jgi:thiol-disulfide isomerase/thioredoxin